MKSFQSFGVVIPTILGLIVYLAGSNKAFGAAGPILWIDDSAGNIGKVDVHSGAVTLVGNAGVPLTDMAYDPSGNLWGITFSDLYTISTITGHATLVGATGINQGNALVFDGSGNLYAAGGGTTNLYTINTATGTGKSVGAIGYASAGDLAFNQGTLYMSDLNNELVAISLTPAVSGLQVGPFGFGSVYGLATGDDGVLYGVASTQIFSVNTSTGHGTLSVNYAGHGLLGANGTAFTDESMPEPASLGLEGIGAVAALVHRRR